MLEIFFCIEFYFGFYIIVIDGGLIKGDVVVVVCVVFGKWINQFVLVYLIVGVENSGLFVVCWDFYQGKKVVVMLLLENSDDLFDCIKCVWLLCGVDIYELMLEVYDWVFVVVSYLLYLLFYVLVYDFVVCEDVDFFFIFVVFGFCDFICIVVSYFEMWCDICFVNWMVLFGEFDSYWVQFDEFWMVLV